MENQQQETKWHIIILIVIATLIIIIYSELLYILLYLLRVLDCYCKSDQIQGGIAPQCFSQQKLKLQHDCHGHRADYKKSVD